MATNQINEAQPVKRRNGRPYKLTEAKERRLIADYQAGKLPLNDICKKYGGIAVATIYNVLERHGVSVANPQSEQPAA